MRGWHWSKPNGITTALVCAGLLGAGWAYAQFRPILHERFDPDPKEDLELGVRLTAAGLPAALGGPSGTVMLPDPSRPVDRKEPAYGERQSASPKPYAIDRNTTDPGRLTYHEPFRPSIAPFKRTYVFDSVNSDFELAVADSRPRPVTIGGAAGELDDQFFGDLALDLLPGELVRVPSVAPHMKVYSAHLEPEIPFGFYFDRAENWFVRAPEGRDRMRLVMHVGVARAAFDGRIEASSYSALISELPQVPANVERVTTTLLQRIGVSRVLAPADALNRLVTYFRGFAESMARPSATQGEALFRELVISRKGVCRHRAYAFVVTSLGLGLPARFVHNEAHAWVEVFGGIHWHRIDLGGAATGIDFRGEIPQGPPHRPPSEAYQWPKPTQSAEQSLTAKDGQPSSSSQPGDASSAASPPAGKSTSLSSPASSGSSATPLTAVPDLAPAASVGVSDAFPAAPGRGRIIATQVTPSELQRGQVISLSGSVQAREGHCDNVRINAELTRDGRRFAVGTLITANDGSFSTKLTIPADLPVGKYDLVLTTPGSKDCPAASTE